MILLLSAALLGVSCAGEKEAIKGTVKGTIYVIGNEPFTSLAVEVTPGEVYRISTSDEIKGRLLSIQGRRVELSYSMADTTVEGIVLKVTAFKEATH